MLKGRIREKNLRMLVVIGYTYAGRGDHMLLPAR